MKRTHGLDQAERGGPFTPDAINRLVKRIGERARFPFPLHVHMLRHACGYTLANAGHDTRSLQAWLGHKNIPVKEPAPAWSFHGRTTKLTCRDRPQERDSAQGQKCGSTPVSSRL